MTLDEFDIFLNNLSEDDVIRIEEKHKDVKYGFDIYIPVNDKEIGL